MWDNVINFLADMSTYAFAINILLGLILVFFERKNTGTLWAWLLLMFFVPVAGFLIYLYFGQDLRKTKMFKAKQADDMAQIAEIQKQRLVSGQHYDPKYERYMDTLHMLLSSSQSVISENNYVDIFTDGQDKFTSLMADLRQAKQYIYIQYYIFRGDEIGNQVMDILCQKAKEGLDVRLLTDGMGSMREKKAFYQRLRQAGGRVVVFYPPFVPYLNFRINFRNHRKLVIIDGRIGYVGGFNVEMNTWGRDRWATGGIPICASRETRWMIWRCASFWIGIMPAPVKSVGINSMAGIVPMKNTFPVYENIQAFIPNSAT